MTSHDLVGAYLEAYASIGLYSFAPIPIVIKRPRLVGDGPASWAVWLCVARPRNGAWLEAWRMARRVSGQSTCLPGAYSAPSVKRLHVVGAKDLGLMRSVVADYSHPGQTVVDACAGSGSTALACDERKFIGAEVDPETHRLTLDRIRIVQRQALLFASVLALTCALACSSAVPGVTLECYADRCPVDEQLQVTLDVADKGLRSLDLDTLSLRIEWHADGELLVPREVVREHDEGSRGQTDPDHAEWVKVTSHGTLLHELAHVAIYRDAGFGADVQESQERHAGAYWTEGVTQLVERMIDDDRIERCGALTYDRAESGELICAR